MVNRSSYATRRGFLKLARAAATGSALAACAGAPRPAPTSSGPLQLVYQYWRTEWFPGLAQEILAKAD